MRDDIMANLMHSDSKNVCIVDEREGNCRFEQLKDKDFFLHNGVLYIATCVSLAKKPGCNEHFRAFNFNSLREEEFNGRARVDKVGVKLKIVDYKEE